MANRVVAPSVGESITEVSILSWQKKDGSFVKTGEILVEIESDKATVEVVAEVDGVLHILKKAGETVPVGEVLAEIDESATAGPEVPEPEMTKPAQKPNLDSMKFERPKAVAPPTAPPQFAPAPAVSHAAPGATPTLSPAARKIAAERGVDMGSLTPQVQGSGKGGRIMKGDVQNLSIVSRAPAPTPTPSSPSPAPAAQTHDRKGDRRVPMSRIRKKIAERLVEAQHNAAILTTFNEVDMAPVMMLRQQYKDVYKEKFNLPFSFMTFFTMAAVKALREIPGVNAALDGEDVIYHDYYDIGIAVGTERGLVVPVIRDCGNLTFLQIEKILLDLTDKARAGKLSIAEMTGGTFTISNGGTYGSMLSTPILNPPQSGILGMHKTMDRAVVVDGKIVVRPMMFLALSYDHRLIDGKEAVTFLVKLKEVLENPKANLALEFLNEL